MRVYQKILLKTNRIPVEAANKLHICAVFSRFDSFLDKKYPNIFPRNIFDVAKRQGQHFSHFSDD